MRKTHASVHVAAVLMADPGARHWGYDLSKHTGLRSGVLYPVLHRMLASGWLKDGWEEHNAESKRPPRRYYELTDEGRRELGALLSAARNDPRFAAWKHGVAW